MKLSRIALAVALAAPTIALTAPANAGVTVTPLLLGYHYTGQAHDEQRAEFLTGQQLTASGPANGGVTKESSMYYGAGVGIELTPSLGLELEYGITKANGEANEKSAKSKLNRFDVDQRNITANLILTSDFITQNYSSAFKPYLLVGGGIADYEIEKQTTGATVYNDKHGIGNLGLGAYYRLNDALTLRGEGRAVYNFDGEWVEGIALAGLNVVLGGHLAPVVPTPPEVVVVEECVDADADGVCDDVDKCPGTAAGSVVDANGCPKEVVDDLRMELRVFFDNDKSVIKDQYKPEIAKVAEKMTQYPNSVAEVEGHASKTGPSAAYNQRLSERRAAAVKSMLTNNYSIAPNRISTVGYGYDRPIAPNNTAEGRAMNRRVYAIITGTK